MTGAKLCLLRTERDGTGPNGTKRDRRRNATAVLNGWKMQDFQRYAFRTGHDSGPSKEGKLAKPGKASKPAESKRASSSDYIYCIYIYICAKFC